MINQETIKTNVYQWITEYLPGFEFRQYQEEYIINVILSILNGQHLNIIEAPTGSGKSIMVMIMAGVLDKYYHKSSYILCSDLYLWQQYADAIDRYHLYFGKIKGTRGNYECSMTGSDIAKAPCKLSMISFNCLCDYNFCYQNGWGCATSCEWVRERKKAMMSSVTLMPYQLYFPYMNALDDGETKSPFAPRNIVFCDECHNIPSLCQQYGEIPLELNKDLNKVKTLLEFCTEEKDIMYLTLNDIEQYMKSLEIIYNNIMNCDHKDQNKLWDLIKELYDAYNKYPAECSNGLLLMYKDSMKKSHKKLTKKEYLCLDIANWVTTLIGSLYKYLGYTLNNKKYIVKTDNQIPDPYIYGKTVWPENPQISFKYAKEDVYVNDFILQHQDTATVMLSATVGDHDAFDENIGTLLTQQKTSKLFVIPSTFDFSKSPIYFLPGNKMSQDYIKDSLVKNAKIINAILNSPKHKDEKGIIHTGSYKITKDLMDLLDNSVKSRIFIYSNSKEKTDILSDFESSRNGVLVGPTLTEGIDFPDDGCRFIIILKVPYPYLGDNLVKAKLALFPRWYNSQTSNNVIQGIGRGNRTPTDWSTTYILDGSFSKLYDQTRTQYPIEMRNRIRILNN